MKNKMIDLNNHLFAQMERLSDESLKAEKLEAEIKRADAIVRISKEIVYVGNLMLKARIAVDESISSSMKLPEILE